MDQTKLFYEDIYDAVGTTITALGGFKKVGYMLWPNMKMESAYARLKNCLERGKSEKLDPEELMTILKEGRKVGCHALAQFISDEAGYDQPKPKEPEDELAELQRDFINSVKRVEALADKISTNTAYLRSVK